MSDSTCTVIPVGNSGMVLASSSHQLIELDFAQNEGRRRAGSLAKARNSVDMGLSRSQIHMEDAWASCWWHAPAAACFVQADKRRRMGRRQRASVVWIGRSLGLHQCCRNLAKLPPSQPCLREFGHVVVPVKGIVWVGSKESESLVDPDLAVLG